VDVGDQRKAHDGRDSIIFAGRALNSPVNRIFVHARGRRFEASFDQSRRARGAPMTPSLMLTSANAVRSGGAQVVRFRTTQTNRTNKDEERRGGMSFSTARAAGERGALAD
jgi:hypothetical protein